MVFFNQQQLGDISSCIARFKTSKNPYYLLGALYLVIIQGRLQEVLWTLFTRIFYPPSHIVHSAQKLLVYRAMQKLFSSCQQRYYTREDLITTFQASFPLIHDIPKNFAGACCEAVSVARDMLIVGEYGMPSARIYVLTANTCTLIDTYEVEMAVRHIHAIHRIGSKVYITTGDSLKVLDMWKISNHTIHFSQRIKSRFAGYFAGVTVHNQSYFGTDFSGRPNYIETVKGKKFPLPPKAYYRYFKIMDELDDRYIIALCTGIPSVDNGTSMTIFDTVHEEYVYCEPFELNIA